MEPDSSSVTEEIGAQQTPQPGPQRARRGRSTIVPVHCAVCYRLTAPGDISKGALHRSALNEFIREQVPQWTEDQPICHRCLNRFRAAFVAHAISQQRGELTQLEEEVIHSLEEQALVSENINAQFEQSLTRGQVMADRVAAFGGSWSFLLLFFLLIVSWVLLNSLAPWLPQFDPYPFILLNLCLSCIAAVQAPIIMMSQNRQEAKDRCRSEQDYIVNLKAELEIRHLSRKLDQLMSHQWQRLLEIQDIQTELLEELFQLQGKVLSTRHLERPRHTEGATTPDHRQPNRHEHHNAR